LDWDLHGYQNHASYGPWAIAETLMNPQTLNSYQMGMQVIDYIFEQGNTIVPANLHRGMINPTPRKKTDKTIFPVPSPAIPPPSDVDLYIDVPGGYFIIYRNDTSKNIIIGQKIGAAREVVRMKFLTSTNQPIGNINYRSNFDQTGGRLYFRDDYSIEFRVNGDGLAMIKPKNSTIAKVKYTFSFYPGYRSTSPLIKKANGSSYNKEDVSHIFMDEYGGFGVYLLDNEKELYDGTSTTTAPSATYSISPGKIFWTSVFPPKQYNFNDPKCRNRLTSASWYSYVKDTTYVDGKHRLLEFYWDPTHPRPDTTYGLVSNSNNTALKNYLNTNFSSLSTGSHFIYQGDVTLWKNWQFDYVPRKALNSGNYSLLNTVFDNLHDPSRNLKTMVYTSPQYFLKGSRYGQTDPYQGFILTGPTDTGYNHRMLNNINSFTYVNGTPVTLYGVPNVKVPILSNPDMLQAHYSGSLPVDAFMRGTNMPSTNDQYYFVPGNREGENMWDYVTAVKKLKDSSAGKLDGIYMDTYYEFNIPRTYQLMRTLKSMFGDSFEIFRHASAKEGQDAYLPQIDAYADFVMTGEASNINYYDRNFMRFFVSTYNISNSVAVLDLTNQTPKINDPGSGYKFLNWLYDYNIMVGYPSIKKSGNLDWHTDTLSSNVDLFYSLLPTAAQCSVRVQNNINYHQPSHQQQFQENEWSYSPGWQSVSTDVPLTGDFNGDGLMDIAVYRSSVNKWFVALSTGGGFGYGTATISWGESTDIPLVGDFDGDGKDDIAMYKTNGDFYVALSTSNDTTVSFNMIPAALLYLPHAKIGTPMTGDFNGAGKNDLLIDSLAHWYMYKSLGTYGFAYDSTFSNYSWGKVGDKPLVGDFNGDHRSDIAVYRTTAGYGEWFVSTSTPTGIVT